MNETIRVRFKRLESFGNYCNAEAEVSLEYAIDRAVPGQAADMFDVCTKAVDEQINAAMTRHEAALQLEREASSAYWEDQERRVADKADAYRVVCHAPEHCDLYPDLRDFDIYIPAGKGDYDASNVLDDAQEWLDELGITPELTVEMRGVSTSSIREQYLRLRGYVELTSEDGAICWMRRALIAEYAITERAAAFGVKPYDSEEPF